MRIQTALWAAYFLGRIQYDSGEIDVNLLNENDSSYILACIGIKDVFAELEMFCCMKWVRSNAKPSANVNKPQKGKLCFLHQKVQH